MKIIECRQGEPEWYRARLGIPTASVFSKILTPKTLKLSEQRHALKKRLLAEWVLRVPFQDEAASVAMERGTELEDRARQWYEITRGVEVQQVGFCMSDGDDYGCSPDGLVGDDGGLEIKVPLAPGMIGYHLDDHVDADYTLQVQGSLWVTGRAYWDVLAWNPEIEPVCIRVVPNLEVIGAINGCMQIFLSELEAARQHLLAKGIGPKVEASA